ncbi:hypothetical protein [Bradyrhizobium diazoefficiens]|uniref:hypothetical protein n=1 Tax=Bradyrhizobium diazoefficiens TaxID=1355477 RepID=UPI002714FD21|nr:hypothetical protein [Bradyrhizobium diazoefficiens]WLB37993.1 hypothetical protein QIH78_42780 [Bradyrhizobium diazoefficiens]WLC17122.1 hypothetical protein QIH76_01505 [Bradyrhizobium diazoefficiens]
MAKIEMTFPEYTKPYTMRRHGGMVRLRWDCVGKNSDGFEPQTQLLDPDWDVAVKQAKELYQRLLEHRIAKRSPVVLLKPRKGSLEDLFEEQKRHVTFTGLITPATRRSYTQVLNHSGKHVLRIDRFQGMRLFDLPVTEIDLPTAQAILYDIADVGLGVADPKGSNKARELWRLVFNNMRGVFAGVPILNPFTGTRHLKEHKTPTFASTLLHAVLFDHGAQLEGAPRVGTAGLASYEFQIRPTATLTSWRCEHWKPASRPRQVFIVRPKVGNSRWIDLYDRWGQPLFPVLEKRLDELKGERTHGPLIPMDGTYDTPWAPLDAQELPKAFYKLFHRIKARVNLPEEMQWRSLRKGGISESAESGCTESELMALSGHLDPRTAKIYVRETINMIHNNQIKRIAHRAEVIQGLIAVRKLAANGDSELDELIRLLTPFITKTIDVQIPAAA